MLTSAKIYKYVRNNKLHFDETPEIKKPFVVEIDGSILTTGKSSSIKRFTSWEEAEAFLITKVNSEIKEILSSEELTKDKKPVKV